MILVVAGLLGASGVALGAASAHLGGGDLARLASFFLLLHAAAVPGLLVVPVGSERTRVLMGGCMVLGTGLFAGDLTVLAFTGHSLVAGMAPAGGVLLIGAWLTLIGVALFARHSSRPAR